MNINPDIITEIREFVLDNVDNSSPILTKMVLSKIDKISSIPDDVQSFNQGGDVDKNNFVTVDKSFLDRSDNTTKTVAVEYDTTTGKATQESIDKVRDALNLSKSNIINPAIQELSQPNFSIMSTSQLEALKEVLENPEKESFSLIPDLKTDECKFQVISTLLGAPPLLTPLGIKGLKAAERRGIIAGINRTLNNREEEAESQVQASTTPISTPLQTQSLDQMAIEREREERELAAASLAMQEKEIQDRTVAPAPTQSLDEMAATIDTSTTDYPMSREEQAANEAGVSQSDVGYQGGQDGSGSQGGSGEPGDDFGIAQPGPYAIGGEVDNADTNMEVANMPMGVVGDRDGAPAPFNGGTGVEDDLDMEVDAGSYILNAEAVQLVGVSDINNVIRDAYTIAARLGKPMPEDYDPQNKVPIRISNGEAVVPKALVDIIGLDKLEKWNTKGLDLRKQKEKMQAQQQQAQAQQPQVASEAPMQQQMGQLMNEGGQPYKIQHIKGLPLKIFNRHLDRLNIIDPKERQEALENFDKYTNEVLKIESDKNWTVKNKYGYKGGFQFGPDDVDMTLNRLERNNKAAWISEARKHKDASRLTPEQQTALFITNTFDKTLLDDKGRPLPGEGDELIKGIFKNDKSSMVEAYERLHYADTERLKGLKGIPTRFRSNVILRFGDDWENKIFDFAKGIKEIFD